MTTRLVIFWCNFFVLKFAFVHFYIIVLAVILWIFFSTSVGCHLGVVKDLVIFGRWDYKYQTCFLIGSASDDNYLALTIVTYHKRIMQRFSVWIFVVYRHKCGDEFDMQIDSFLYIFCLLWLISFKFFVYVVISHKPNDKRQATVWIIGI